MPEDDRSVTAAELRLAAMDLLARREHGSQELASKLSKRFHQRHHDAELLISVIEQLTADGLLSDERFAASRVRQLAGRGYGPNRIRNDLRQHRVDQFLSPSMDEAFDAPVDWTAEAASVYQKKYRGQAIIGDFDSRQRERGRRMRFLQHRGFDAEIIQRLVNADDKGEERHED